MKYAEFKNLEKMPENKQQTEKLPPQDIEAEKSLLGCLMVDPQAIVKVVDFLLPRDFYQQKHKSIYAVMMELFEKRSGIDVLSVSSRLKEKNKAEETGGAGYLTELVNSVPTASHIVNYAKIVQQKRILRDLISAGYDISSLAQQETADIDILLDQAEKRIFSIAQRSLTQAFAPIKDSLEETWKRIDELSKHKGGLRGIPTGFKALDNILSGLQKSDLIILAARPSLGKCVSGDTQIISSNLGKIYTIKELVERKESNILSLNEHLKICPSQAKNFLDNGIKPVFKLRTALGKEIEATKNHPFLTIAGWKPLNQIKLGTKIAMPRILPIFGKTIWPNWKIKCLAYYIAEGGLTGTMPRFTSANKEILADFTKSILKFPNVKLNTYRKGAKKTNVTLDVSNAKVITEKDKQKFALKLKTLLKKERELSHKFLMKKTGLCHVAISKTLNGHSIPLRHNFLKILDAVDIETNRKEKLIKEYDCLITQNNVAAWLKKMDLMGKLAIEKFIPEIVFTFDKQKLALFLNRIFACDGSFWQDNKNGYHLSYSSSSKKLIKEVQHLLLRFGIVTKVRQKNIKLKGKIFISYEIEAHDAKTLLRFIKEIGIFSKEKKLKKAKSQLLKTKIGWAQDTIPIEVWQLVEKAKGNRSWASLYSQMGLPSNHNIHAFRRSPRRETIAKLAHTLNSPELKNIAQSDIYWDKVVDIKYQGRKRVYDLTVPNKHNFIANDFIIHNSSLAINIARHLACEHKIPVGIFSLEMSKDQIIDRLLSSMGNVDSWRLRTGRLSDEGENNDFDRIQQAMSVLAEAPIYIDDTSGINTLQIRAMARRLFSDKPIGLLIVDYMQLMEHRNPNMSLVQQVTENSRSLKVLARELNVPVLVLSQLSRAVEQRTPPIPRLSDLRDSGGIEQDADVVMFIHREDRYKENSERQNIADIIIAKHRNGPVGKVELFFDEARMTFRDIDKGY